MYVLKLSCVSRLPNFFPLSLSLFSPLSLSLDGRRAPTWIEQSWRCRHRAHFIRRYNETLFGIAYAILPLVIPNVRYCILYWSGRAHYSKRHVEETRALILCCRLGMTLYDVRMFVRSYVDSEASVARQLLSAGKRDSKRRDRDSPRQKTSVLDDSRVVYSTGHSSSACTFTANTLKAMRKTIKLRKEFFYCLLTLLLFLFIEFITLFVKYDETNVWFSQIENWKLTTNYFILNKKKVEQCTLLSRYFPSTKASSMRK